MDTLNKTFNTFQGGRKPTSPADSITSKFPVPELKVGFIELVFVIYAVWVLRRHHCSLTWEKW